jgi:cytochrome c oxidase subunit 2
MRACAVAIVLLLPGCASPTALDPHGPRASRIATLGWLMFGIAALVFAVVLLLILIAGVRSRSRHAEQDDLAIEDDHDIRLIMVGGIIIPALVLVGLFVFTLRDMRALSSPNQDPAMTIEVTGRQWFWDVRYPEQGFTTANEIHIPVGQPVMLKLMSSDVIHSFWVPEIAEKTDTIPGQTNTLWIEADDAGVYRGQCAEFCGRQHANMAFLVVADPPDQFQAWLAEMQSAPPQPSDPLALRGRQVFLNGACAGCHTVSGTDAAGTVGPDLTHLATREYIAAGTLPNTTGYLGGWVVDPQHIKPGTQMPPSNLASEDLQAVLAYLNSLK